MKRAIFPTFSSVLKQSLLAAKHLHTNTIAVEVIAAERLSEAVDGVSAFARFFHQTQTLASLSLIQNLRHMTFTT